MDIPADNAYNISLICHYELVVLHCDEGVCLRECQSKIYTEDIYFP